MSSFHLEEMIIQSFQNDSFAENQSKINLRKIYETHFEMKVICHWAAFDQAIHRVNEKEAALDGVREKYKLVHKEYGRTFNFMLNTFTAQLRKQEKN